MKVPEKDQIQYIHYHTGRMQDASSGAFYKTDCGGRLLPVEQYEHEGAVLGKFKCQKCGVWVNVELKKIK